MRKEKENELQLRLMEEFDRFAEYNLTFLSKAFHKNVRVKLFRSIPATRYKSDKALKFLAEYELELTRNFKKKVEELINSKSPDVKLINYFTGASANDDFLEDGAFQEFANNFFVWRKQAEIFFNVVYQIDFYALNFDSAFEKRLELKNKKMMRKRINPKKIVVMATLRFLLVSAKVFVFVKESMLLNVIISFASLLLGFPTGVIFKAFELLHMFSFQSLPTKFILPFAENATKKLEKKFLLSQLEAKNSRLRDMTLFFAEITQLLESFFKEYAYISGQASVNSVAQNKAKIRMFTVVDYILNTNKFSRDEVHALLLKTSGEYEIYDGSWIVYNDEKEPSN